jgi:hypothetical protein
MDDLAHVVLWVSHILIRHADVVPKRLSFQRNEWRAAPDAPTRSREEALERAREVESHLRSGAVTFDEVARRVSEDVATRDRGGSLGGIAAIYLRPWPQALDALAALDEGEVSRVIETEFGFHILLRRSPPPERRVSGARIIIGHEDTTWFGSFPADRRTTKRSRVEAEALARSIFAEASAHPERFAELVQKHSEHRDHLRGGDFGEWSTREPTSFAPAIEVLQGLREGQVAAPEDSLFGYQIVQRTPLRPRREYAMRQLSVPFSVDRPPTDDASRAAAAQRADEILRVVQLDPSRFGEYQDRYCCNTVQQWSEGRGSPLVERSLEGLELNQVASHIIESDRNYLIIQRVAPSARSERPTAFDLPAPEHPDMRFIISRQHGLAQMSAVPQTAALLLSLDRDIAATLASLHEAARREGSLASSLRWPSYEQLQAQTLRLLGPERYQRYLDVLHQHFEDTLLGTQSRASKPED